MHQVQLTTPIKAHGETILTLELRDPKASDLKKIDQASCAKPFQFLLDFAAILSDVPPSSFDDLSLEDTHKVCGVVAPMMGKFQEIGQT